MNLILLLLIFFPRIINFLSSYFKFYDFRGLSFLGVVGFGILTGLTIAWGDPVNIIFFSVSDSIIFGFSLDPLSGIVSTTVIFIGSMVMRFSERYLADDLNKSLFHQNIANTICFVLLMLNSMNLLFFWLFWVGTSYYLHKLLLHFNERVGARIAAQEKFWVSRMGDVFILITMVALYQVFGSLNFSVLTQDAEKLISDGSNPFLIGVAGVSLVLGVMTKSAQFPFHFWLPKTMETPTPVSALMHAGIINAGGFLVIRMGSFLNQLPWALNSLAIVGGVTAFFGSFVMLSQTNIKRSLAYSTISQMGFMMLQCGLGAFTIAIVHIVGHAFYKAHSFLSSGSVTDIGKMNRYVSAPECEPMLWTPFVVGFVSVITVFLLGPFLGYSYEKPGAVILLLVLGLACAQIFISHKIKSASILPITSLIVIYFSLYHFVSWALEGSLLTTAYNLEGNQVVIHISVGVLFVSLYLIQNNLNRILKTEVGQRLYIKSLNGGELG